MVRGFLALIAIAIPLTFAACGGDDETTTETSATADSDATTTEATGDEDGADDDAGGADDDDASAGGGATASGPGGTVTIGETEYKLDPSDPTVKSGEVTFDVSNDGDTVHDLEVEGDGVEEKTDPIEPGDTARLAVALEAGTYEIYCTIDGHRDLGMEGTLTVQ